MLGAAVKKCGFCRCKIWNFSFLRQCQCANKKGSFIVTLCCNYWLTSYFNCGALRLYVWNDAKIQYHFLLGLFKRKIVLKLAKWRNWIFDREKLLWNRLWNIVPPLCLQYIFGSSIPSKILTGHASLQMFGENIPEQTTLSIHNANQIKTMCAPAIHPTSFCHKIPLLCLFSKPLSLIS